MMRKIHDCNKTVKIKLGGEKDTRRSIEETWNWITWKRKTANEKNKFDSSVL